MTKRRAHGVINRSLNVVSGAVASKKGAGAKRKVYVDKNIPKKFDKFLAVHERAEADAMDRGMSYSEAHTKVAIPAERRAVKKAGLDWDQYSQQIAGHLSHIEHERICKAPRGTHVNPKAAIEKPKRRARKGR